MIGSKVGLKLLFFVQEMRPNVLLSDSLMKGYRLAPRSDYLVARAVKDAKKAKRVKKQTKKARIHQGGPQIPHARVSSHPITYTVDDFKKECQDIQNYLFSGTMAQLLMLLPREPNELRFRS